MTIRLGAHVSSVHPLTDAAGIGAELVQVFVGDPQSWKKPVSPFPEGAAALKAAAEADGVGIVVHSPYVLNVASTNNRIRIPSRKLLQQTITESAAAGAMGVVVHGGHVTANDDPAVGFENWRKCIDGLTLDVPIFIENTAGGNNAMARQLDAIERLWEAIADSPNIDNVGFCLDTCHAHAAGLELDGLVAQEVPHYLETEGDGRAHTLARGDVAVDHHGVVGAELGALLGEDMLEVGVRGGATAGEEPELGEDRGRRADGRDLPALPHEAGQGIGERRASLEVGGTGDAAGKHEHVVVVEGEALVEDGPVTDDGDRVTRGDLERVGDGHLVAGDPRAEEQVDHRESLDLLEPVRHEHRHAPVSRLSEHALSSRNVSGTSVPIPRDVRPMTPSAATIPSPRDGMPTAAVCSRIRKGPAGNCPRGPSVPGVTGLTPRRCRR